MVSISCLPVQQIAASRGKAMAVAWAERWQLHAAAPVRKGSSVASGKPTAPNLVLRFIRETERRESREEFAAAVVNAGRQLGDYHSPED
jgi:hypothetical protein